MKKLKKKNVKTKSNNKIVTKQRGKKKVDVVIKKVKKTKNEKVKVVTPAIDTLDKKIKEKVKGEYYFTKETEDSIIAYNNNEDKRQREVLYNTKIKYAFEKIAENIYNTFKFSYADVSPLEIQKQCISHMVANIDKYEQGKGKAFGYFSIVAKHWFILDNNNTYRRFKRHVEICEHPGDSGEFVVQPEHIKRNSETREFIKLMVQFWDTNVTKYFTKDRDIEIANAVVEIFRNSDRIDVFNKKALYLYIREIAGCQTQHITKIINKMKASQEIITNEYRETGTIEGTDITLDALV